MKKYFSLHNARIAIVILAIVALVIMYYLPPAKTLSLEQLIIFFVFALVAQILAIVQQVKDKKSKDKSTIFLVVSILADFTLSITVFFCGTIILLRPGHFMQGTRYDYTLLTLILLTIALYVTKYKVNKA